MTGSPKQSIFRLVLSLPSASGSSGVSICTFVLVKQVNSVPCSITVSVFVLLCQYFFVSVFVLLYSGKASKLSTLLDYCASICTFVLVKQVN